VLFAAFRNPAAVLTAYLTQPGLDVWVMPAGTDNFVRTSGFLPAGLVADVREIDGVAATDPLVRIFVRVVPLRPGPRDDLGIMLLAVGYRVPDGLGSPPSFLAGHAPRGDGEVALDRAAAFRLGVTLGDALSVNGLDVRVVGLTEHTNLLITQLLFFDAEVAEHTSGLTDQVSFVVVRATSAESVARRIHEEFPGVNVVATDAFVRNSVRESASGFVPVLALIAVLGLLAAAVLVALLMQGLVEDRRKEIAVLAAMGLGANRIGLGLVLNACLLVGAGTLIGGVSSLGLDALLGRLLPTVQLTFMPADVAITLGAFFLAGVIGALLPTLRLRAIDPLEAFES
jgi:putative ABC transport system permease protein